MPQTKVFRHSTKAVTMTGLFMAMTIMLSSSIFSLPVPGGHLYFNDMVICTASILLGDPVLAFIAGGIGSFLGDMLFYPAPMFVSLVTHGLQAVVISLCSKHLFKDHPVLASGIGVLLGAVVMVTGYTLGRAFVYSTLETSLIKLPFECVQALVGVVISMLLCWKFKLVHLYRSFVNDN